MNWMNLMLVTRSRGGHGHSGAGPRRGTVEDEQLGVVSAESRAASSPSSSSARRWAAPRTAGATWPGSSSRTSCSPRSSSSGLLPNSSALSSSTWPRIPSIPRRRSWSPSRWRGATLPSRSVGGRAGSSSPWPTPPTCSPLTTSGLSPGADISGGHCRGGQRRHQQVPPQGQRGRAHRCRGLGQQRSMEDDRLANVKEVAGKPAHRAAGQPAHHPGNPPTGPRTSMSSRRARDVRIPLPHRRGVA